ncbi:unnamed protein product [Dibothriocephalus latus]|uniref:Amino acid transporter transmembrane domain-containing protein n=1 Tax=Dibothriocephalus latus TaxID=60516 RepID=A0A3P7M1A3_DIBLA|nr:unnamed protein product [Dibothriocephalus latus]
MLVGFNVSISDMGSDVVATIFETRPTIFYRRLFLIGTLCVVLPLCLLRRIELISWASSIAVLIYVLFLTHVVFACGLPKLFYGNPLSHVRWWRIEGLVHCLPVVASSLCFQVLQLTVTNNVNRAPSLPQTEHDKGDLLSHEFQAGQTCTALSSLFCQGYWWRVWTQKLSKLIIPIASDMT